MAPLTVKLPDGSALELEDGATGADAAAAIGPRLAKDALAVRVDGEVRDLAAPLADGERDRDPHPGSRRGRARGAPPRRRPRAADRGARPLARHQGLDRAADRGRLLLRLRVSRRLPALRRRPGADRGADGAPTSRRTSPSSAPRSRPTEAIERFRAEEQPYKVELIEDLVRDEGVETVSLYRNGPFVDLCRGPHGPSTGRIKAFKLSSVAGAYWRGDENRQMLTRIYGTAFFSEQDLEEHLERLEQARARDHRRLGPQLGLFMLLREAPGMPFWLPNGNRAAAADREQRCAGSSTVGGYVGDQDPAGPRRGALAPLGALGQLPREHVLHRQVEERRRSRSGR